jgi:alpha-L-rhamnosidase
MYLNWSILAVAVALFSQTATLPPGPSAPVSLRCEYLSNPIAIDVVQPRFFWIPVHGARGVRQSAYQLLVATRPDMELPDQWDSGRVASDAFTHIVYAGKPLESGRTYYWKVRYWDSSGAASPYSRTATFGMGLLTKAEWRGRWIGGGNELRREISLPARPVRARAYVAGIGYYELRINGQKIGDHVLDPGYTTYAKRILYVTHDVTGALYEGSNAIGLLLGEGWYAARAALLQINIELPGGTRMEVVTDGTWKVTRGPILSDSLYDGEHYDARRGTPGWDLPGYRDETWKSATLVDPPTGTLSAQMMPPIRVVADMQALKMSNPRPGMYVFDLGQNVSGWVRLHVKGPRGTAVRIRHAELLYEDGTINVENLRSARATDVYVLRGDGEDEVYEPRFTYHGFRYVELTGYPGTPTLDTILGRVVHTDVRPTGGFASSTALLNRLQRIVVWGIKTNLHSIPTDCDQRDERMGWMADAHVAADSAMLNFDMAAFYTNFLRDIADSQEQDGSVPDTVPRAHFAQGPADPAWGSAYPLILFSMYERYGDRRLLEQHFEAVRRWADFLASKRENGIVTFSKFGDWISVEQTPGSLVSTFYCYWSVDIVARAAAILGRAAEADRYRRLADEVRQSFHSAFYDPRTGQYGGGAQTANLLPLYLDIAPDQVRGAVAEHLRQDIVYRHDTHLTTGLVGTKYLLPYLTRTGNSDLAYELATQTSYPSWGYMIERGATTLWELWQEKTGPSMNSHNHPMLGSVGAWLYEALGGINLVAEKPGYERVRIEPQVVRDLQWASATVDTLRGVVISSWSRSEGSLRIDVTIPFGATADVHLPKLGLREVVVEEGGRPVWTGGAFQAGPAGIIGARETDTAVIVQCGSGSYGFEVKGR